MNRQKDIKKTKEYLEKNGWHTYYNENYWVNERMVKDHSRQDYTNYGLTIEKALETQLKWDAQTEAKSLAEK